MTAFRWIFRIALTLVTLLTAAPFLVFLVAIVMANVFACQSREAMITSCVGLSDSVRDLITVGLAMGWVAIFTFPILVVCGLIWLVILIQRVSRKPAARSEHDRPPRQRSDRSGSRD